MSEDTIYLDHNATTPVLPEAVDAMLPYLRERYGNPSSGHAFGRTAREAVEKARGQVAALLGCDAEEILFTSGGTESNNLAIRGVTEARPERRHVVTSSIEHPAVAAPCAWLERHGWRVTRAGVDAGGRVRLQEIVAATAEDTALVTIMHANNETGVLQPVAETARAARERGVLVHTDAAQSVGKVPVSVRTLDVDLLSVAGHKLYAPKGVGALYVRQGTPLRPFALGAGHERGLRPGTENVASVVGLGAACERARRDLETEGARVRALREWLWERLRAEVPGIAMNGHPTERLPNTLSVRFPGVSGTNVLAATPGVAASAGSACHAGHEQAPAVIVAMGVPPREALGSVRLTLGRGTTGKDIERAAAFLAQAWRSLIDGPGTGAKADRRPARPQSEVS
jgi:cysteine desulfurase